MSDRVYKMVEVVGTSTKSIEEAVQNALASSFMKQGQICIGTSMVLAEDKIYEGLVKELTDKAGAIVVRDPCSAESGMGALPTEEHLDSVHQRVAELKKQGARILCGGRRLKQRGYFYPPTIIEVDRVMYEEFFAPVILIKKCSAKDIEEAIRDNPTGLVLQLWSRDSERALGLAKKARCGTVWINTFAHMSAQTPFGGARASGWGRNLGKAGFFEYVQPKHIGIGIGKSPVEGWFGV